MKKFYKFSVFYLILFLLVGSSNAQVNVGDSLALVDLYNNTNGQFWNRNKNWLTSKPVNTWYGVGVKNNRVDSLHLPSNKLNGSLVSSFGNLTSIRTINFYSNKLEGAIPTSFGNLTKLEFLNLAVNKFTNLPSNIGNCIKLRTLAMSSNKLNSLPPSILQCINLENVYLALNNLSGNLPPQIVRLKKLISLDLYYNQFSGEIPASLGQLTELQFLNLGVNQFTGNIPIEMSNLIKMKDLNLQSNQLTGSIPTSFSTMLANDGIYYFSYNQLTGFLPPQITPSNAYVNVDNNNYNFDGLEPAVGDYPKMNASGNSISQNALPLHVNGNQLSIYAGGTLSNNTYYWYKNSILVKTKVGDSTYNFSSSGTYSVVIENSVLGFYSKLHSTQLSVTTPTEIKNKKSKILLSPNVASE